MGNLIPNMEKAWDEIAYIQTGDNAILPTPGLAMVGMVEVPTPRMAGQLR